MSDRFIWHVCHALALFLVICVIFERLVPGAVLGHGPLFIAVPLLIVCLAFHPFPTTPTRWWTFIDVWLIAALCIGRIFMQLSANGPLAWLVAGCASALVLSFVWIFRSQEV